METRGMIFKLRFGEAAWGQKSLPPYTHYLETYLLVICVGFHVNPESGLQGHYQRCVTLA